MWVRNKPRPGILPTARAGFSSGILRTLAIEVVSLVNQKHGGGSEHACSLLDVRHRIDLGSSRSFVPRLQLSMLLHSADLMPLERADQARPELRPPDVDLLL